MVENAANQIILNKGFKNFKAVDMAIDGVIGGISGAVGGRETGTKHLNNLGKQSAKRIVRTTVHKGAKAGVKTTGKAFSYYAKSSKYFYKPFVKGLGQDFVVAVGSNLAPSGYVKNRFWSRSSL